MIRDLHQCHPLLLCFELIETESNIKKCRREVYEGVFLQDEELEYNLLPPPFRYGNVVEEESLQNLSPSKFWRLLRALFDLQQKALLRNGRAMGPFPWWLGISSLLRGDAAVLRVCNSFAFL